MFFEGKIENGKWHNHKRHHCYCLTLSGQEKCPDKNSRLKRKVSAVHCARMKIFRFINKEPTAQATCHCRVIAITQLVPEFALSTPLIGQQQRNMGN